MINMPSTFQNIHAYIGPGTGSLIIQFLVAADVGVFS